MISRRTFFRCLAGGVAAIFSGWQNRATLPASAPTGRITATEILNQRKYGRGPLDVSLAYQRAYAEASMKMLDRKMLGIYETPDHG